jgi:hypothetical protein
MNLELERVCVWVKIHVRCPQNDHAEVFGVITDFGHCGVDEGSVVIHIFQGDQ